MQTNATFTTGLTGDAAALAGAHSAALARLPATLQAFVLVELQKWPVLFAAERRYQRTLLEHLSRSSASDLEPALEGISRIEADAGIARTVRGDPARFQDEAQTLLRRHELVGPWRSAIDAFFQHVNPALESQLYPSDAPRRLVVQLYGHPIAVEPTTLWRHFEDSGFRVPFQPPTGGPQALLRQLFGVADTGPALFDALRTTGPLDPFEGWVIESDRALHDLCSDPARDADDMLAGLSYELLGPYREALMRALYDKVLAGVDSPQAFAAYARSLTIAPDQGAMLHAADILKAFIRDVFLAGNGTLFVNNTFVEWAAVQALRRAQPRVLVTRYGVRHRFRPFTSMVMFAQPESDEGAPLVEDPEGSFVDVEQLSFYVWLNAEKNAAYRGRTLYLFIAESANEMLVLRSDRPTPTRQTLAAATPSDICATMAHWLGAPLPDSYGHPIAALTA